MLKDTSNTFRSAAYRGNSYVSPNPAGGATSNTDTTAPTTITPTLDIHGQNVRINELTGGAILHLSMSAVQRNAILKASTDYIVIDISGYRTEGGIEPTTIRLNNSDIRSFAAAGKRLEIIFNQGSMILDAEACASLAAQLKANSVDFMLELIDFSQLSDEQQAQLREAMLNGNEGVIDLDSLQIISLSVRNGSNIISKFDGLLTVTLPWNSVFNENLVVWYIGEDGSVIEMPIGYDEAAGTVHFTTDHLSLYAIGFKLATESMIENKSVDTPVIEEEPAPAVDEPITLTIDSHIVRQGEETLGAPLVAPQIINGRTMLPFRYLIQTLLGGEVDWDEATRTVTAEIGDTSFEMTIDDSVIIIDGEAAPFDQAPVIVDDVTLVPLRVFEKAVQSIEWDETTKTVTIVP